LRGETLQIGLDRVARVSAQRWFLAGAAIGSALGASLAASLAGSGGAAPVLVLVAGSSVGATARPDAPVALLTIVVVVWQWLVTTDDTLSPFAIGVASGLVVFHTLIALLDSTPPGATIERAVLLRWARRVVFSIVATAGVWGAAVLLDRRPDTGSTSLTVTGIVVAILLALALRVERRTL
jgi:hypothetical protein